MSFGPWFPLTPVGLDQHAPEGPAAVQIKREAGLIGYPTGKSAMVFYFFAETSAMNALEHALGDELDKPGTRGQGPLRFRVWEGEPARGALQSLFREFVERFGAPPLFHAQPVSIAPPSSGVDVAPSIDAQPSAALANGPANHHGNDSASSEEPQ